MADGISPELEHSPNGDLSVRRLYLQLANSRAETILSVLSTSRELPEPSAETLTLAAAALAHVSGTRWAPGSDELPRAVAVARALTAEAHRHDRRAGAFAERALHDLEQDGPMSGTELLQESAESLAWAAAVLRFIAAKLEQSEEGNAEQLELAWMCLFEAADLLAAGDRATIEGREPTT